MILLIYAECLFLGHDMPFAKGSGTEFSNRFMKGKHVKEAHLICFHKFAAGHTSYRGTCHFAQVEASAQFLFRRGEGCILSESF